MIDLNNITGVYTTNQAPLDAYLAHLNHISSPQSLRSILENRHSYTRKSASEVAGPVSQFIEQAIHFYRASRTSSPRVRPVTQYYAYLNLAVACVLIYKPKNWEAYRSHGAEELSRTKRRISLTTPAVKVSRGTLSLFNRILSDEDLSGRRIHLLDLLVPVHMVHSELASAYKVHCDKIDIIGKISRPNEENDGWVSRIELKYMRNEKNRFHKFPVRRVHRLLPMLSAEYRSIKRDVGMRIYQSIQTWSEGNFDRAKKFHDSHFLKAANLGGHTYNTSRGEIALNYGWRTIPKCPLIPTATAALLLSFYLSSLARYRPNIVERSENSRINLLFEVFSNESDGFMIPLFRNLLYHEVILMEQSEFT